MLMQNDSKGKQKLVIICSGGLGDVIRQAAVHQDKYEFIGFCDDKYQEMKQEERYFTAPIKQVELLRNEKDIFFFIAVGDCWIRKALYARLNLEDDRYATIIHPAAFVDTNVILGHGVGIMPQAIVHNGTSIGNHTIVNSASVIEHKNQIADFVSISPNTTLCGFVTVNSGTFIGVGSTVVQCLTIGSDTIIGAGSLVLKNIPPRSIAYGSPVVVVGSSDKYRLEIEDKKKGEKE